MNAARSSMPGVYRTGLMLGMALLCSAAPAAEKSANSDALARYQQERAACLDGRPGAERDTCLREASAARAQAQRGGLDDAASADHSANQRKRCDNVPDKQRKACLARVQGDATTSSGSVAGGGILRERVTREPAAVPSPLQSDIDARDAPAR